MSDQRPKSVFTYSSPNQFGFDPLEQNTNFGELPPGYVWTFNPRLSQGPKMVYDPKAAQFLRPTTTTKSQKVSSKVMANEGKKGGKRSKKTTPANPFASAEGMPQVQPQQSMGEMAKDFFPEALKFLHPNAPGGYMNPGMTPESYQQNERDRIANIQANWDANAAEQKMMDEGRQAFRQRRAQKDEQFRRSQIVGDPTTWNDGVKTHQGYLERNKNNPFFQQYMQDSAVVDASGANFVMPSRNISTDSTVEMQQPTPPASQMQKFKTSDGRIISGLLEPGETYSPEPVPLGADLTTANIFKPVNAETKAKIKSIANDVLSGSIRAGVQETVTPFQNFLDFLGSLFQR
jgi:hypothetical protein